MSYYHNTIRYMADGVEYYLHPEEGFAPLFKDGLEYSGYFTPEGVELFWMPYDLLEPIMHSLYRHKQKKSVREDTISPMSDLGVDYYAPDWFKEWYLLTEEEVNRLGAMSYFEEAP